MTRNSPRRSTSGLSRIEVIILLAMGIALVAFVVHMQNAVGKVSRKNDCRNSLKQIGVYLSLYNSKFGSYPPIGTGTESWFGSLWRPDIANDGNLFRCAVLGKGVTTGRTDYWCINSGGSWYSSLPESHGQPFKFTSASSFTASGVPLDLPIACDQMSPPSPHAEGIVNVLKFGGQVHEMEENSEFVLRPPKFIGSSGWVAPPGTR